MSDNNLLNHRGYLGSIEVSTEDRCLYGSVQFINDLISYYGENYDELEKNFRSAVDDYLAFCAETEKEPSITHSGTFNVRIGSELHKKAVIVAKKKNMNLNEFVKLSMTKMIDGTLNNDPKNRDLNAIHSTQTYSISDPNYHFRVNTTTPRVKSLAKRNCHIIREV